MKYKDLKYVGKFWYFILAPIIIALIIAVTLIAAVFTLIVRISKFVGLLDAFHAWTTVLAEGFAKKVKHATTRKGNS